MSFSICQDFFAARWQARVSLSLLFWRDMLGVATLLNLLGGFLVLIVLAQGLQATWALVIFFALKPYNLFLLLAVWRSPQRTPLTLLVAGLWFGVMLLL